MSGSSSVQLSPLENQILVFFTIFLINLGMVSVPAGAPAILQGIIFAIGIVAFLMWGFIPNKYPSQLTATQVAQFGTVAAALSSINLYITQFAPHLWYWGLLSGTIGAVVLAVEEYANGKIPAPTPPASAKA
jgi:hypothetical protein